MPDHIFFQEIQMKYISSCYLVALLGKDYSDLFRQDNFDYSVKKKWFFQVSSVFLCEE